MTFRNNDLDLALADVTASSAGGSPFLIAYGATFLITGVLSFFIPLETAALIAMFQGGAALPLAFWLERRLSAKRMESNNPLRTLAAQMAMSQALALPALIILYNLDPVSVPVFLAAIGGVHFVPYAWLHRTRLYAVLAVLVAIGAFALRIMLSADILPITMLYIGIVYWLMAPLLYLHATRLSRGSPALAGD